MSDAHTLDQLEHLLAFGIAERMQPAPHQDPWSQVADGTLSIDQAVAQARALDPDASLDDLRRQAALFAPPSPDERDHQLRSALALRFPGEEQAPPPPRGRPRKLWAAAAGLAAAASLALIFLPADPLPEYASKWTSSDSMLGSGAPAAADARCQVLLHPSRLLLVELRPTTAVTRPVGMVAWAEPLAGGPAITLPLEVEVNERGFITASAPMDTLGLRSGRWTITFVIGDPDRLVQARELAALPTEERPDVGVLRDEVCVVE